MRTDFEMLYNEALKGAEAEAQAREEKAHEYYLKEKEQRDKEQADWEEFCRRVDLKIATDEENARAQAIAEAEAKARAPFQDAIYREQGFRQMASELFEV